MHAFRRYGVHHFDLWGVWRGDIFDQFDADGDFVHDFGRYGVRCQLRCERRGDIFDHFDANGDFVHHFGGYRFRWYI